MNKIKHKSESFTHIVSDEVPEWVKKLDLISRHISECVKGNKPIQINGIKFVHPFKIK